MKYTLLVFFVGFTSIGYSQKLLIGPMVGGRISKPMYEDKSYLEDYNSHWMPGFQGGISSVWQSSGLFMLASDLYYAQEGKKISGDEGLTKFSEYHHLIGLPVTFRVTLGNERFKYYGGVGPNIRYWIKSNGTVNVPELIEITDSDEPVDYTLRFENVKVNNREVFFVSDPNRLQLGIDFNAGVMLPLHQQWLAIDLKYSWGHTNMAKPESSYTPFAFFEDNLVHTQQSLQISCAYLFSFDLFELTHKGKSIDK